MVNTEVAMEWDIFLIAGVGSSTSIFNDCTHELQQRFHETGREPVIRSLFPYGDRSQSLMRQIAAVGKDLSRLGTAVRAGGKAIAEQVRRLTDGRPALFIGHSGGGVAAYLGAYLLCTEGVISDCRVIQVGSPKLPIHPDYRSKVSYYFSVDDNGKRNDPVTRIGSWGGWNKNRLGMWYWDRRKYAPGHISTITVMGGHPHYFRGRDPFIHPSRGSNLTLTLNTIWDHVTDEDAAITNYD